MSERSDIWNNPDYRVVPGAVPRRNTPSFNALRHVHSPSREILITRFPFARDSKRFDSWSNRRERGSSSIHFSLDEEEFVVTNWENSKGL